MSKWPRKKDRETGGHRYMEVFKSNYDETDWCWSALVQIVPTPPVMAACGSETPLWV